MASGTQKGTGAIGAIFLLVGVIQFLKGDNWIVWLLLGFLMGGFSFFSKNKDGGDE